MFMLVSRRYERASLIVTSNKPFSAWGKIFGDDATAAAMIDRLVRHAEILSARLRSPAHLPEGGNSQPARRGQLSTGLDTGVSGLSARHRWARRAQPGVVPTLPRHPSGRRLGR